jgi:hypothetical protein
MDKVKFYRILAIFAVLVTFFSCAYSQDQTFRAYAQAGFNTNQISGDSTTGFNYWGFRGGVGAYVMLSKRISTNMEINYTMRGASGEVFDEFRAFMYHRTIHTNYIEMPIMVNYHDGNVARFGGGLVLSNLMDNTSWYNMKSDRSESVQNLFKQIDLGFVLSVAFDIKKHFGFNMRMNQSILPFNKRRNNTEENMYHTNLSASWMYYF